MVSHVSWGLTCILLHICEFLVPHSLFDVWPVVCISLAMCYLDSSLLNRMRPLTFWTCALTLLNIHTRTSCFGSSSDLSLAWVCVPCPSQFFLLCQFAGTWLINPCVTRIHRPEKRIQVCFSYEFHTLWDHAASWPKTFHFTWCVKQKLSKQIH